MFLHVYVLCDYTTNVVSVPIEIPIILKTFPPQNSASF